jgi:ligand-binding sensor domain-containing protein
MDSNSENHARRDKKNLCALLVLNSFIILLVLSSLTRLFAYTFEVYTDKSTKFKVLQQNNYIWMATNGGAIRWDMMTNLATEYTTARGLSDNYLTRAISDSAGNVWFLSSAGIDMFDGQTWRSVNDSSGPSNLLRGSQVLLANGAGKTMYICFYDVNIIKLASATDTFSDTLPTGYCFKSGYSYVDLNGRLWAPFTLLWSSSGAPMGFSLFDGFTWRHVPDSASGLMTSVFDMYWPAAPIDTGAGRFKYRFLRIDGKFDTVDCSKLDEFNRVKDSLCVPPSMTIDTAGRLWIGTESGLACCDKSGAVEFNFQTGPLGTYTSSLAEDTKGNLWVCGGLSIFDGQSWTYPRKTHPDIGLFGVAKVVPSSSDSGGMWLKSGTYYDVNAKLVGNGIAYYNGRSWDETKFYTKSNGLPSDAVLDIAVDSVNTLWCVCGGDSTHLCMFKNNAWITIAVPDGLKGEARELHIDKKGGVWLLANNPARFDGAQWQVFTPTLYEGYAGCTPVFEDSKGTMWFGTYSKGLHRYDGTNWSTTNVVVVPTMITSIGEDLTGAVWVGLGCDWTGSGYVDCAGLWRQNGTGWKKYSTTDGLGGDLVTIMSCDKTGAMWFGCGPGVAISGPSVSRFAGTQWKTFTTKDGFSDTRVNSILNAKNGDIWFATYTGITRLKSSSLAARFTPLSNMTRSDRVSISKILVMPGQRAVKTASATLYDIRGRRVSLRPHDQNQSRMPIVNGVYFAVYPSGGANNH